MNTEQKNNQQVIITIAKGGILSVIGIISYKVLIFLFQMVLARGLSKESLGVVSLGLSIVNVATIFTLIGLQRAILKFISEKDQLENRDYIQSSVILLALSSIVVTLILLAGEDYFVLRVFKEPALRDVLKVLILSIPFSSFTQLNLAILQARKLIKPKVAIEQFLVPGAKLILVYFCVLIFSLGIAGVAWVVFGVSIVGALISAILVARAYPGIFKPTSSSIRAMKPLIGFALPLFLTNFISTTGVETETFMLGILTTSGDVGLYYVGLKITSVIVVILHGVSVIFAPVISEAYAEENYSQVNQLFTTVTRIILTLTIPLFLLIFLFSPDILAIIGSEYKNALDVMRILSIGQLLTTAVGPAGWMLIMSGNPKYSLINSVVLLASTLFLDLLLVPAYGAMGAAIAAACGLLILNLMRIVEVRILLNIQPYTKSYLKPVFAGIITGAVLANLLPLGTGIPPFYRLASGGLIAGMLYFSLLALFKLEKEEKELLMVAGSKFRSWVSIKP